MIKSKLILALLLILSTLLPIFSSCGECEHQWEPDGYIAKEPTDKEVGYRIFVCLLCGETKSEEIPKLTHLTHDYSKKQWGSDDTYHWLCCTFLDCTATTSKSRHALYPSSDGYTCQICMATTDKHSFSDKIEFDESCHWLLCDEKDCPVIGSRLPHTLGDDSKCTECGYSATSHTKHVYSKWAFDEESHWLTCNIGNCTEATEKTPHTWIDNYDGGKICKDCKLTKK